jgi:hypothetical protein
MAFFLCYIYILERADTDSPLALSRTFRKNTFQKTEVGSESLHFFARNSQRGAEQGAYLVNLTLGAYTSRSLFLWVAICYRNC